MSNKADNEIKVGKAKGRPMLAWVGKKPLEKAIAYPAQKVEAFGVAAPDGALAQADWSDWPERFDRGGLLFHGDNKDVLAHLLANGFRGKVKLIYIDPPFDSGADYVRKVQLRGPGGSTKIEGEDYTLGEQIQYTDIWANDNYLQFMYERLLLLKELLSDDGVFALHVDEGRSHYLKIIMDEVFGSEHFINEVVWKRQTAHSDVGQGARHLGRLHDVIFLYSKGNAFTWNQLYTPYSEEYVSSFYRYEDEDGRRYRLSDATAPGGVSKGNPHYEFLGVTRYWRFKKEKMEELYKQGRIIQTKPGAVPAQKRYLDEMPGVPLQSIWDDVKAVQSQARERADFPTQKPEALLERLLQLTTKDSDLVLDCFVGSGTTLATAQKLGRRWIGCDINKGAIQTTAKRLHAVMREQAEAAGRQKQGKLAVDEAAPPKPAQLGFTTWRVNDYDLQIQHNEAVELACEHIGITRTRSDGYFDGRLGNRLVKIIPFNHPLSPLDLDDIERELRQRPEEERDVTVVCLGLELAARAWVEQHNRNRPINRYHLIELRTDSKYGGFIKHEPLTAEVSVQREGEKVVVEVTDVFSPTIMQRLNMEEGLFRAQIDDWRAVVDCIMIDTDYDGETFNVALSDIPARKDDLVEGRYEIGGAPENGAVAVKIIDMLGEEVVVVAS